MMFLGDNLFNFSNDLLLALEFPRDFIVKEDDVDLTWILGVGW